MFRILGGAARFAANSWIKQPKSTLQNAVRLKLPTNFEVRNYSSVFQQHPIIKSALLLNVNKSVGSVISRNVVKFGIRKGKRKSVKAVLSRFYRLHWGGWIRRKAGCQKKLWKKSSARKRRLRQHVFCNATQSTLLDKMVGPYWRKPRYYVDDPYNPYHVREEFAFTSVKPRPYFPPDDEK